MSDILTFSGPHRLLSNMAATRVLWGDALTAERLWPCTEVPYFLARTASLSVRERIMATAKTTYAGLVADGRAHVDAVEIAAKSVKKMWRSVGPGEADRDRKVAIMRALVWDKIGRDPAVAQMVAQAGRLQEGNHHGDVFWGVALEDMPRRGVVAGQGENMLGQILMAGRDILKAEGAGALLARAAQLRAELFEPAAAVQPEMALF